VRVEVAKLCDDLKGDLLVSLHVGLCHRSRRPRLVWRSQWASIGIEEELADFDWRGRMSPQRCQGADVPGADTPPSSRHHDPEGGRPRRRTNATGGPKARLAWAGARARRLWALKTKYTFSGGEGTGEGARGNENERLLLRLC
jgi:hypothetical protein